MYAYFQQLNCLQNTKYIITSPLCVTVGQCHIFDPGSKELDECCRAYSESLLCGLYKSKLIYHITTCIIVFNVIKAITLV